MAKSALSRSHALRNYIVKRLLLMVPTLLGITIMTFLLTQFVPGGPIDQIRLRLASGAGPGGEAGAVSRSTLPQLQIPDSQLKVLKQYFGFDKPIPVQYWDWLKHLACLNLGDSFRYTMPVAKLIEQRLPISLYYGLITTVLTYLICIPLGIVKAIRHKTVIDNVTSIAIFLGYAIPGFALGAVLLVLFSVKHDWFPLGGFVSQNFDQLSTWGKAKDLVWHSVLPLISYLVGSFAVMTMLMKNSLMENMSADFVKTALAKGVTWPRTVFHHAMRNSLIPIATSFGNNISLIVTGSVLIERVFNIQGIGLLSFDSVLARDYPVVLALVVVFSVLALVGNLLSDLCVAFVDPRVRFE